MTEFKHVLTWREIWDLREALAGLICYVSDNSCSDPDCCGEPYYDRADLEHAETLLACYGLKWNGKTE
jgi:hypothetical protein